MDQPQPQPQMKPQSSGSLKWLLMVLVLVIVIGGSYLVYAKYGKGTTPTASPSPVATVKTSPITSAAVIVSPAGSPSVTSSSIEVVKGFYTWYLDISESGSQAKFASTNPYKLKNDFATYLTSSLISNLESLFNNPNTNYDPIICAQDLPPSIDYTTSDSETIIAKMNFTSGAKNVTLKLTNDKISSITCP